jgi:SAM-dependent methyltransferase
VTATFYRALAREAARRYAARDRFARHFAFGKLTRDPAFRHLLEHGLLPRGCSLLDLGCGQGVLESLLLAARDRHAGGDWPAGWPPPPGPRSMRGIDLSPKDVVRARQAAGDAAQFVEGDIRSTEFGRASAIVILDVLHYIDYEAQDAVLQRVRAALAEGGVLLLRVADASATLRFRYTEAVDWVVTALRGHRPPRLWSRPVRDWTRRLDGLGFQVESRPMSQGTPFANVLLVARYDRR